MVEMTRANPFNVICLFRTAITRRHMLVLYSNRVKKVYPKIQLYNKGCTCDRSALIERNIVKCCACDFEKLI